MLHGSFQLNKVRRLINVQGQILRFEKQGKNEFGEPNGETDVFELRGVFHETTSFVSKTTSDSGTIRKKSSPMVLTLWESLQGLDTENVSVNLNGITYKVSEITNLLESNLVADISLEEVQT